MLISAISSFTFSSSQCCTFIPCHNLYFFVLLLNWLRLVESPFEHEFALPHTSVYYVTIIIIIIIITSHHSKPSLMTVSLSTTMWTHWVACSSALALKHKSQQTLTDDRSIIRQYVDALSCLQLGSPVYLQKSKLTNVIMYLKLSWSWSSISQVWNYKQRRCLFTLLGHLDYIRTTTFHHVSLPLKFLYMYSRQLRKHL